MSPFNLADLFSPRIWSSFFVKDPLKKKGKAPKAKGEKLEGSEFKAKAQKVLLGKSSIF